jgi:hypothetical protein
VTRDIPRRFALELSHEPSDEVLAGDEAPAELLFHAVRAVHRPPLREQIVDADRRLQPNVHTRQMGRRAADLYRGERAACTVVRAPRLDEHGPARHGTQHDADRPGGAGGHG